MKLSIRELSFRQQTKAPTRLKRWPGPSCSELILRYTILGGSHFRFPKVGKVRTRATRAAPMTGTVALISDCSVLRFDISSINIDEICMPRT